MYRIIGGDGREYGPISAEQLRSWIAQNRADSATRVKTDDSPDWVPLGERAEFAPDFVALATPPPLPVPAIEPPPIPGVETPAPPLPGETGPDPATVAIDPRDAATYVENCLRRSYQVGVRATVSRAYDIVAKQVGLGLLAILLVMLARAVIGAIPALGQTMIIMLDAVFEAGLLFCFLAMARSGRATLGDAFVGFRVRFLALAFFSVIRTFVVLSFALLTIAPVAAMLGLGPLFEGHAGAVDLIEVIRFFILLPLLLLPAFAVYVAWTFVPFLIVDRELGVWEAMELSRRVVAKRWFKLMALHLAFIPINLAGLMTFGVGLLYTFALQHAAFAAVYEDAFRE